AGCTPFRAETLSKLCAAVTQGSPESLRARRPDVPAPLEAAILGCLAKSLETRVPSVIALARLLVPFASERGHVAYRQILGRSDHAEPLPDQLGSTEVIGVGAAGSPRASSPVFVGLAATAEMGASGGASSDRGTVPAAGPRGPTTRAGRDGMLLATGA